MVVLQIFVILVCPREVNSGSFYSSILANPPPLFQLYVSHIYFRISLYMSTKINNLLGF